MHSCLEDHVKASREMSIGLILRCSQLLARASRVPPVSRGCKILGKVGILTGLLSISGLPLLTIIPTGQTTVTRHKKVRLLQEITIYEDCMSRARS
jgi:hypothetical protein